METAERELLLAEYNADCQSVRQIDNRIWAIYGIYLAAVGGLLAYLFRKDPALTIFETIAICLLAAVISISKMALVGHLQNASDLLYDRLRKLEKRLGLCSHRLFKPKPPTSEDLHLFHRWLSSLRARHIMQAWGIVVLLSSVGYGVHAATSGAPDSGSLPTDPPSENAQSQSADEQPDTSVTPDSGNLLIDSPSKKVQSQSTDEQLIGVPQTLQIDMETDYIGIGTLVIALISIIAATSVGLRHLRQMQKSTSQQIEASGNTARISQRELTKCQLKAQIYDRLASYLEDFETAVYELSDELEAIHFKLDLYVQTGYGSPTQKEEKVLGRWERIRVNQVLSVLKSYEILLPNATDVPEKLKEADGEHYKAFQGYFRCVAQYLMEAEKARESALSSLKKEGQDTVKKNLFPLLMKYRESRKKVVDTLKELRLYAQQELLGDISER